MAMQVKATNMVQPVKPVDGRTARADNTRRRIVTSMIALIEEGQLEPTAAAIAARAGVSVRSVFQHFADLEAVFQAAADQTMQRVWSLVRPVPETGPVEQRIEALLDMRWNIYDQIAAIRRAATLLEHRSPALAQRRRQFREVLHRLLERAFGTEVNQLPRESRAETLDAMVVIADFEFMDVLRQQMGLSRQLAYQTQRRALMSLLAAATR